MLLYLHLIEPQSFLIIDVLDQLHKNRALGRKMALASGEADDQVSTGHHCERSPRLLPVRAGQVGHQLGRTSHHLREKHQLVRSLSMDVVKWESPSSGRNI